MNNAFVFLYMAFLLPANSAWADAPAKSLSLSEIVHFILAAVGANNGVK